MYSLHLPHAQIIGGQWPCDYHLSKIENKHSTIESKLLDTESIVKNSELLANKIIDKTFAFGKSPRIFW